MKAFETFTTVESQGDIRVIGVPFAPGTEVEVVISQKRKNGADFIEAWQRLCQDLRSRSATQAITENEIQKEIDDYRSGR